MAESGSIRRAAKQIGVEQSAISRRIRYVENELGAQLFQRHSTGVSLTDIGTHLLDQIRLGTDQLAFALESARTRAEAEHHLKIGVCGPLSMGVLPELFRAFRQARPRTGLRFSEAGSLELIAAVRRGQIDVGIVCEASPSRGCVLQPLWSEQVYLVIPECDPLADREVIRWRDLGSRQFVVTDLPTGHFAKAYLRQHLRISKGALQVDQLNVTRESIMQIVAHGGGITIAGSAHARLGIPGVAFRLIQGAMLRYAAVYSGGCGYIRKDVQRLMALVKAVSEKDHTWFSRRHLIRPNSELGPGVDVQPVTKEPDSDLRH
ncbi:MAG: LysR family transcriptional regulator [Rhodospirillales bacterium]|nr:LysR family transcriptional regulator [Rhodospirillales bacterium]